MYDPLPGRFLQTDPVGYQDQINLYAYVANDPLNNTDPTGRILDTIADVIFIIADVAILAHDEITNGGGNRGENLAALGADAVGAAVPFATGAGLAVRGARAADHAVDAGRAAEHAADANRSGPDFIVTSDGAAMRPSAAANRTSLDNAGVQGRPATQTSETGTIHTTPGRDGPMDLRIMNGGSGGPPRVVTSRAGTNDPVQPSGQRFPNGTPRQERRDRSHVELEP